MRALICSFLVGLFHCLAGISNNGYLPISSGLGHFDHYHKVIFEYHSLLSSFEQKIENSGMSFRCSEVPSRSKPLKSCKIAVRNGNQECLLERLSFNPCSTLQHLRLLESPALELRKEIKKN
jgi:hypothetical protein